MKIGEIIKACREVNGLSLRELQKKSGLNYTTIHLIESKGRIPKPSTCDAIADALDISRAILRKKALAEKIKEVRIKYLTFSTKEVQ